MIDTEASVLRPRSALTTSGSSLRVKLRNFDPSPVFHKRVKDRLSPLDLDVLCEALRTPTPP